MKTIHDIGFEDLPDLLRRFKYQKDLTAELDKLDTDFTQATVNEIVLWKVNRYAKLTECQLVLINKIKRDSDQLDESLTREILTSLLSKTSKGIQLPMASTILRFKNPKVYQIIDQRAYRFLNQGHDPNLNLGFNPNNSKTQYLIDIYLKYLHDLRIWCAKVPAKFEDSDRILYRADKDTKIPLKGSRK